VVSVQVQRTGVSSAPFELTVTSAAPGVFTLNGKGSGQGLIFMNGQLADHNSPAGPGDVLVIYATGLGATGPGGQCLLPVTVSIAGVEAEVLYAGLAEGFVGLYQVNAIMPASVSVDQDMPLVMIQDGQASNLVTLATRW
jgi:uncharacterized protein (TIGR03437 family)